MLLDNGRTRALADQVGRQALRCIRCSACLNVCPVYERVGGHAYGSVYPGPIGAILNPLLRGRGRRRADRLAAVRLLAVRRLLRGLPGAHRHPRGAGAPARRGRRRAPRRPGPQGRGGRDEGRGVRVLRRPPAGLGRAGLGLAGRVLGRLGRTTLPGGRRAPAAPRAGGRRWTGARDLPAPPRESFRAWWKRHGGREGSGDRVTAPARRSCAGCAPRSPTSGRDPRRPAASCRGAPRWTARPWSTSSPNGSPTTAPSSSGAPPPTLEPTVAAALPAGARVVVPPGLGFDGRAGAAVDDGLTAAELDALDGVVTEARVGIAETGTIVLDHGPGQGRRAHHARARPARLRRAGRPGRRRRARRGRAARPHAAR